MSRGPEPTIFLQLSDGGVLRDALAADALREHMQRYGEVADVWVPWKPDDRRYFAFLTFADASAAGRAVEESPHNIGGVEVAAALKRGRRRQAPPPLPGAQVADDLEGILQRVPAEEGLSWDSYAAPGPLIQALRRIGSELDPGRAARLHRVQREMFGGAEARAVGCRIVLLHGPPGTGKTLAMRTLAAQSGLQAWLLRAGELQRRPFEKEELFAKALDRINDLKRAMILLDECETLFPRRDVMAGYASVDVRSHQRMLDRFLQWSDGLEGRPRGAGPGELPPVLCLATNLKDQVDPAVLSRASSVVLFGLPGPRQCTEWWRWHARQLGGGGGSARLSAAHAALGLLSYAARLSFRDLWKVAEAMAAAAAAQEGAASELPTLADYVAEILRHWSGSLPSLGEALRAVQQFHYLVWTVEDLSWLAGRARRLRRARL